VQTVDETAELPAGDGSNWWVGVRAVDVFGNAGPTTNAGPFRIDGTPPSASGATVQVVLEGDYLVGTAVTSVWSGFSDNLSGLAGYYYGASDGGGTTAGLWTAATEGVLAPAVPDGTNHVYVWARDKAGMIGPAAGTAVLVLHPDTDFDADGMSSGDERVAGTDPGDGGEVFAFRSAESATQDTTRILVVDWPSVTGRVYNVYAAGVSANGIAWVPLTGATNLPGTGESMSYTDTVTDVDARLYKAGVRKP
jgi:hypothetical protein